MHSLRVLKGDSLQCCRDICNFPKPSNVGTFLYCFRVRLIKAVTLDLESCNTGGKVEFTNES